MLKRVLGWACAIGFLATAAALVGCPAPREVVAPAPAVGGAPSPTTVKACRAGADCAAGEVCLLSPGCDAPGTCGPPKPCTRDNVAYCGCDGTTFHGSSTCPSKPYRSRGGC